MSTHTKAFTGRPFHRGISLAIDAVVIALESTDNHDRRERLRREKAKLEAAVPRRRYAAIAQQTSQQQKVS